MSHNRGHSHHGRRDANEKLIVAAFEKLGATVARVEATSPGVPDLLVGVRDMNLLCEIKVPKTGKLSEGQKAWRDGWKGQKPFVVTCVDDVTLIMSHVAPASSPVRRRVIG